MIQICIIEYQNAFLVIWQFLDTHKDILFDIICCVLNKLIKLNTLNIYMFGTGLDWICTGLDVINVLHFNLLMWGKSGVVSLQNNEG